MYIHVYGIVKLRILLLQLQIHPSSSLATVLPEVDVSKWSPKGPACLQYLCLVPFISIYNPDYQQRSSARKVKISVVHRKRRMKEVAGRTNCRNILGIN